jgi:tetratricopeptide (TPR) repeat protein
MFMKNKIKKIVIIAVAIFFTNYFIGLGFFYSGKAALDHNEYKKAASNLKIAVLADLNNLEYRYYYADALYFLSDFENSQKEFEKIIKQDPMSKFAPMAMKGIQKTQSGITNEKNDFANSINSTFSGLGNNYINNITFKGKIVRWSLDKQPIKIYFEDTSNLPNFKSYYISSVTKAFDKWLKFLNGKLKYEVINNKDQADIIISFAEEIKDHNGNIKETSSQGLTSHGFSKNMLKSVNMVFVYLNPDSTPVSKHVMYSVALHEAGHALGFMGHSYDKTDIMYPVSAYSNNDDYKELSLRDISTMQYLYNLDADISNVPNTGTKQSKYDKNKLLLGSEDARLNKELKEAIDYVNTVPDNSYGWIKLGDVYTNAKNFDKAIPCYKKAMEIDPASGPARESLALAYARMGNTSQAINEYSSLVSSNPDNIALSTNLALLYLQENKRNEADRVVNALIAVNPNAKNDETVKQIIQAVNNSNFKLQISGW